MIEIDVAQRRRTESESPNSNWEYLAFLPKGDVYFYMYANETGNLYLPEDGA